MKVLIAHYRSAPQDTFLLETHAETSAGTDGVSLEIAKRAVVLRDMGHEVSIVSALPHATYPVPSLEYESEKVFKMNRNLFGERIVDFKNEKELMDAFETMRGDIERDLHKVFSIYKPGLILVHNMFCLPVHPASTVALTRVLNATGCPCSATHHDIMSEGAYKFTPTCDFACDLLTHYFPPTEGILIKHYVINTRNQTALRKRGFEADIIHDSMDFEEQLSESESERLRKLIRENHGIKPSDIVLFLATRIVSNKQAEIGAKLTQLLASRKKELVGKRLYNRETFTDKSQILLVIAGRPERTFREYRYSLYKFCDDICINWKYVGDVVRAVRKEEEGLFALFPDMYTIADLVLYPSGWEGFGNQLIEAFQNRLPVVVFEYPVFQEDIKPKGFEVISLGSSVSPEPDHPGLVQVPLDVLKRAASEVMSVLTDPAEYKRMTEKNYELGKSNFGFDKLRAHLEEVIAWAKKA